MIHARSSIFFKTYTICWLFVVFAFSAAIVGNPSTTVTDTWRDNQAFVNNLFKVLLVVASGLGLISLTLLGIELAIRRGWEPHFLEIYRPACEILEVERLLEGKSNVTVKLQNGSIEAYEADQAETKELEVGSLTHLWVIGAFVSRVQVFRQAEGIYIPPKMRRMGLKPNSKPFLATITIIISTALSGYLTAYGWVVAMGGSMIVPSSDYDGGPWADLYMGIETHLVGLAIALIGMAIFGGVWYLWAKGWDETTFQGEASGPNWD